MANFVKFFDCHAPTGLWVLSFAFTPEHLRWVDMAALVQVLAPNEKLVTSEPRTVMRKSSSFLHVDPASFKRLGVRDPLQFLCFLKRDGLCIENDAHASLIALDTVIDFEHSLDIDVNSSLFLALTNSALKEVLAKVDCTTGDPPSSVSCLVHGHVLAVVRVTWERVPHDN